MSQKDIYKFFPTLSEDDISEALTINGKKVIFFVDSSPVMTDDDSGRFLSVQFHAIDVDTDNILCTERIKILDLVKQVKDQDGYRILKRNIYSKFIDKLKNQ